MIVKDKASFEAGMLYMQHKMQERIGKIESAMADICHDIQHEIQWECIHGVPHWNGEEVQFEVTK